METRGADSEINRYMEEESERILKAAADMYDVTCQIERTGCAAGADNSPELAAYLQETAEKLGIFDQVVGLCPFGASEDYSYFMERVQAHGGQAAYMMIGANLMAGHHDAHFDFDESALVRALQMISCTATGLLRQPPVLNAL